MSTQLRFVRTVSIVTVLLLLALLWTACAPPGFTARTAQADCTAACPDGATNCLAACAEQEAKLPVGLDVEELIARFLKMLPMP